MGSHLPFSPLRPTRRLLLIPLLLLCALVLLLSHQSRPLSLFRPSSRTHTLALGQAHPPGTPLSVRLASWSSAPVGEPADWVSLNLQTCPPHRISANQNEQQLKQSHHVWASLNSSRIAAIRAEMIEYLLGVEREGLLDETRWGEGQGIVFTAGNADTFARVLVTLKLLHRHINSPLPSEIFSFPGEAPTAEVKRELEELGCELRVVQDAEKDNTRVKNYHIKSTAIILSKFREVLYLDSDNMPTAGLAPLETEFEEGNSTRDSEEKWGDPAGLWESKAYKRLGVMFWPDYWKTSADNPIWSIIGVPCRDEWEQESGQILINKSLHLDALHLTSFLLSASQFPFFFHLSDGDKDLFRFSFLALRKQWGLPGRFVGAGAFPSDTLSGFCGHTMLQHDQRGRPIFVHANLLKQIPSGIGPGYAWGKTRSVTLPPSSPLLSSSPLYSPSPPSLTAPDPSAPPAHETTDWDVDCDMLADADNEGRALSWRREGKEVPVAVRRRAGVEKGLRGFFHGGSVSAICIDIEYHDPRTSAERAFAHALLDSAAAADALLHPEAPQLPVDISYTTTSDGIEMDWNTPLEVLEWGNDVRLREFEKMFFVENGHLNGDGFQ